MNKMLVTLSTFGITLFTAAVAFAEEGAVAAEAAATSGGANLKPIIALGAGIAVALAALGSALGQGRAAAAAMEGIGRNPQSAGPMLVPMVLALAFMEALTLFAWLVANSLAAKL